MATRSNSAAPLSAVDIDKRLEATIDETKYASAAYLDNPSTKTEARFVSASAEAATAMQSAGHETQARQMRNMGDELQKAKTSSKKQWIMENTAKSLYGLTVKTLATWVVVGAFAALAGEDCPAGEGVPAGTDADGAPAQPMENTGLDDGTRAGGGVDGGDGMGGGDTPDAGMEGLDVDGGNDGMGGGEMPDVGGGGMADEGGGLIDWIGGLLSGTTE